MDIGTSFSTPIVNVAVAGGTGVLGSAVLGALRESRQFKITVLSRRQPANVASGTKVAVVDYEDMQSLECALSGQDALVCTVNRSAVPCQIALIDAAVAAGVKRFIPSEFGANLDNENCRRLLNYSQKLEVQRHLEKKIEQSAMTYTYIYTNVLMDWSLEAGILLDIRNARACLYDGGTRSVSMCTVPTAAQAVVSVLLKYDTTENRAVYVHEIMISQRALLQYTMKVTPHLQWRQEIINLGRLEDESKRNKGGASNLSAFHASAMKAAFAEGFGNSFPETDNELLGIPQMTESDLMRFIRSVVHRSA